MITVTLPFDENDPMYARNCGSRKTDVYLFEIAGYALACDMGGVSPDAEHIPDTMKGLTRVRKEEGASNVLFALKEGKTAREIGELALDMIKKRNDIETETEYLFYYNHLWVNMLRNFFVFAGEESATRENMSYLAQFLPDEKLHGTLSTQCGACSPRILRMKGTVCGFCFFLDPCAVGVCSRFLLTMWKNSFREIMKKKISRPSGVHGANLRASHQQGRERTLKRLWRCWAAGLSGKVPVLIC